MLLSQAVTQRLRYPRDDSECANANTIYNSALIVSRPTQHMHRMRQQMSNRIQRLRRALRTSRQIHDQRLTGNRSHGPRQHRRSNFLPTDAPHLLANPRNQAFRHSLRGLWGIIPRSQPRPASCKNNIDTVSASQSPQLRRELREIIRKNMRGNYFPTQAATDRHPRGPRSTLAPAASHSIAYGNNRNTHQQEK